MGVMAGYVGSLNQTMIGGQQMHWEELITLARQHAAASPYENLQQVRLRLAIGCAYYAIYHALARSNADLLIGASEAERGLPEWNTIYIALGGDCAHQQLQGDYSRFAQPIKTFVDTFLALHDQRLLAEEDPEVVFTAAEAQDLVERAAAAIDAFMSVDAAERKVFAVQMLLRPTPPDQGPAD